MQAFCDTINSLTNIINEKTLKRKVWTRMSRRKIFLRGKYPGVILRFPSYQPRVKSKRAYIEFSVSNLVYLREPKFTDTIYCQGVINY